LGLDPEVRGALLHTIEPDGMKTLGFTEAGIFGAKIGLNSAGIGLVINGMTTTDDDWSRLSLPFHAAAGRSCGRATSTRRSRSSPTRRAPAPPTSCSPRLPIGS
jgi:hypothetical protein